MSPRTNDRVHLQKLLAEGARYIGSGLLVFPLGLLVSALLHEVLGQREEVAVGAAFAVMLLVSFTLARLYIFRASGDINRQLARFALVSIAMRGAEYLAFLMLFRLAGVAYLFAMMAALLASSVLKFFLYRVWAFERPLKKGAAEPGT